MAHLLTSGTLVCFTLTRLEMAPEVLIKHSGSICVFSVVVAVVVVVEAVVVVLNS